MVLQLAHIFVALSGFAVAGSKNAQQFPALSSYSLAKDSEFRPDLSLHSGLRVEKEEHLSDLEIAKQQHDKLMQAAADGVASAQQVVAESYWFGELGLQKNERLGLSWYTRAANNGDEDAQVFLAKLFIQGHELVQADITRAIFWAEKAASKGQVQAMEILALVHYKGQGTVHLTEEQRMKVAVTWWKSAAAGGSLDAKHHLGTLHRIGNGVKQDMRKAVQWYKDAVAGFNGTIETDARKRDIAAKTFNNLGVMYQKGMGITTTNLERNLRQALKYFDQAAALGHEGSRQAVDSLRKIEL